MKALLSVLILQTEKACQRGCPEFQSDACLPLISQNRVETLNYKLKGTEIYGFLHQVFG